MSIGKVLIVEDDPNISKLVDYNLQKADFKTRVVNSGEDAIAFLEKEKFEIIILDIMLPGMNGMEVCRKVKNNKKLSSTKVLMLTAKGEEVDKVLGFELGADDYVVKPFSPRELVLRVKAILRRNETVEDVLTYGTLKVDVKNQCSSICGSQYAYRNYPWTITCRRGDSTYIVHRSSLLSTTASKDDI